MTDAFVLDASALGALILPDEHGPNSEAVRDMIRRCVVHAPPHWPVEVANMLVMATRRNRLQPAQRPRALAAADIIIRSATIHAAPPVEPLAALAFDHHLTAYDAAYLALAQRLSCRLATTDKTLRRAATAVGVALAIS